MLWRNVLISGRTLKRQLAIACAALYNLILLRRFQCLLDLEGSVSWVVGSNCLFKNVSRGRDIVMVKLCENKIRYNKVSSFQDAHSILASKAVCRLIEHGYVKHHQYDVRLDAQLPDWIIVSYWGGQKHLSENMLIATSKFLEWFIVSEACLRASHLHFTKFEIGFDEIDHQNG